MVVNRHGSGLKRSLGFTLPEVLTVIAVVGILASIAVPSFGYLVKTQRTKDAGYAFFNTLNVARSEAVKRNLDVTITPVDGDWKNGWNVTVSGETVKTQQALKGVKVTTGSATVVYQKSGRVTEAAKFDIDVDAEGVSDYVRCVRTALSGLPRASKGACP